MAIVGAGLVALVCAGASLGISTDSQPDDFVYVGGAGAPALPKGRSGKVAMIAMGLPNGLGAVPFVLRNNTHRTVANIQVSGTAYARGKLLARGQSESYPWSVPPGGLAIGAVDFGKALPDRTRFKLGVSSEPALSSDLPYTNLRIVSARLTSDRAGEVFLGIARNGGRDTVVAFFGVACFDKRHRLRTYAPGVGNKRFVRPGEEVSFEIRFALIFERSLPLPCAHWLLAGSGARVS